MKKTFKIFFLNFLNHNVLNNNIYIIKLYFFISSSVLFAKKYIQQAGLPGVARGRDNNLIQNSCLYDYISSEILSNEYTFGVTTPSAAHSVSDELSSMDTNA